jgi:hypothetical protein
MAVNYWRCGLVVCLLTTTAFLAGGCSLRDTEILQVVSGEMRSKLAIAPGRRIKLLSWSEAGCSGTGFVAGIDEEGKFRLTRMVWRGGVSVIVQKDLLCLETETGYIPISEETYGPAPYRLDYTCRETENRWRCETLNDGQKPGRAG